MANPTPEQQRIWKKANPERVRLYMVEWRAKNQEHIDEYKKHYVPSKGAIERKRKRNSEYYHEKVKNDPAAKAKRLEHSKSWAKRNADKVDAQVKKYKETHREELNQKAKAAYWKKSEEERKALIQSRREYQKQYREQNKKQLSEYRHNRYASNIDEERKRNIERYKENRHEYIVRAEDRNRKLRERGSHTQEDIDALYEQQRGKCAGCNIVLANTRERSTTNSYEVDHVMPVALGGSNNPDNLQLLCRPCNRRKHAIHPDEWAMRLGRLFV